MSPYRPKRRPVSAGRGIAGARFQPSHQDRESLRRFQPSHADREPLRWCASALPADMRRRFHRRGHGPRAAAPVPMRVGRTARSRRAAFPFEGNCTVRLQYIGSAPDARSRLAAFPSPPLLQLLGPYIGSARGAGSRLAGGLADSSGQSNAGAGSLHCTMQCTKCASAASPVRVSAARGPPASRTHLQARPAGP